MKIAIFVGSFPTLSETFILNQITGLLDRGHEVDIFANSQGEGGKEHPDVKKYNLMERTYYKGPPDNLLVRLFKAFPLILKYLPRHPLKLLKVLNINRYGKTALSLRVLYNLAPFLDIGENYDIIHCHFGPHGEEAAILKDAGVLQGKLIVTFHGYDVNVVPQQHEKPVYAKLFNIADLYTVNTEFIGDRVGKLGGDRDKIVTLPVGVDVGRFPFEPKTITEGDKVQILTVARLVEVKGLEYSIKAIARLLQNRPNIEYKIVGDGPLREELNKLICELGVDDKVKLLGWRDREEVIDLYKDSHIFILSSVTSESGAREGQGLVIQEAQAAGLPVLSTGSNGIPEGVLEGESAYLVPPRNVSALTERLEYLLDHEEDWPEMGRAGRKYVKKNYDINKLNDCLVKIYERVVRGELP